MCPRDQGETKRQREYCKTLKSSNEEREVLLECNQWMICDESNGNNCRRGL